MTQELIDSIRRTTTHVLETLGSEKVESGQSYIKNNPLTSGVVTGIINMSSQRFPGDLAVSFDRQSILKIVNQMFLEKFEELNKEVVDAVGEITNMICGGIKQELSEKGFVFCMARPLVITGESKRLEQFENYEILVLPFTTKQGQFVIETNIGQNRV